MGHASRSIPIIQELIHQGHTIHVATDGLAYEWIKHELKGIHCHKLKETQFSYPTRFMWFNGFIQIPKFILHLYSDHKQAKQLLKSTGANVIISDNRLVFRNPLVTKNIYITHQVNIHNHYRFIGKILSGCHQYFIKKFSECWIPDDENNRLAGKLSEAKQLSNILYVGNITRVNIHPDVEKNIDILILLSGPEPQRSYLEKEFLKLLSKANNQTIVMVRGSQKSLKINNYLPQITVLDLANSYQIEDLLNRTKRIVCRSGYSTLMDIKDLQCPVILIPTPGQAEQEYLAEYLCSWKEDYQTISQKEVAEKLPKMLNIT